MNRHANHMHCVQMEGRNRVSRWSKREKPERLSLRKEASASQRARGTTAGGRNRAEKPTSPGNGRRAAASEDRQRGGRGLRGRQGLGPQDLGFC